MTLMTDLKIERISPPLTGRVLMPRRINHDRSMVLAHASPPCVSGPGITETALAQELISPA